MITTRDFPKIETSTGLLDEIVKNNIVYGGDNGMELSRAVAQEDVNKRIVVHLAFLNKTYPHGLAPGTMTLDFYQISSSLEMGCISVMGQYLLLSTAEEAEETIRRLHARTGDRQANKAARARRKQERQRKRR